MVDMPMKLPARPAQPAPQRDWPGWVNWVRLHWRGELSGPRTLLFSACVGLIPVVALLLFILLILEVQSEHMRLNKPLGFLALVGILIWLVWWNVGIQRRVLRLQSQERLLSGLVVFLLSLPILAMSLVTGRDIIKLMRPYESSYSRSLRGCADDGDPPPPRPWTVMAMQELHRIVASGPIDWGSARELERVLQAHPGLKLLELDSPGGYVLEMNLLQEIIARHQLDTLVLNRCASACTLLFLQGQQRYIGPYARFGFHRPGYCGMPDWLPWDSSENMYYSDLLRRGISDAFARQVLNTPFDEIWIPSRLELKREGFATHWWSERPAQYSQAVPAQAAQP